MKKFDVAIIGAGPAGAALAYQLHKNGISTCLIDKAAFPRKKLCGGLVTNKTYEKINEIFGEYHGYVAKSHKIRFFAEYKEIGSSDNCSTFRSVDRKHFDMWCVNFFKNSGGAFFDDSKACFNHDKREIKIERHGKTKKIKYKVLVGADGALSTVRKLVDNKYKPSGFCIEAKIPKKWQGDSVNIYFNLLKDGYIWVFPNNVGAGTRNAKKDKKKIITEFNKFCKKNGINSRQKISGAAIPCSKPVKRPCQNHIILIGDAAGLVDSMTGEGLYFAFLSSQIAAKCISNHIKNEAPLETSFNREIKKIQTTIKRSDHICKAFLRKPFLQNMHLDTAIVNYVCDNVISNYNYNLKRAPIGIIKHCKKIL
ncbi:MAG: geranylgeranyl reductase family protein [Coriobacteriales bacterium]|nr:geranylgeranyl reductase family protein [Coriobacteriales bacterium]